MSVVRTTAISCDGTIASPCGMSSLSVLSSSLLDGSSEAQRGALRKKGWRVNDRGDDYCPDCRRAKGAQRRSPWT